LLLAFLGTIAGIYGTGIVLAVRRAARDKLQSGVLSAHDGEVLVLAEPTPKRAGYSVSQAMIPLLTGAVTRVTVTGVALGRDMSFRLVGLTYATGRGLEGRLVVDGTKNPVRARRLFGRDEVKHALRVLCGSQATFKRVDLYPGGRLIVDVADGHVDDLIERLLRFCEAIDTAAPYLDVDQPRLGSTSGSASSAAFSIEIRS
jgi:hypothetical protein